MTTSLCSAVGTFLFFLGSPALLLADEPETAEVQIEGEANLIGRVADGTPSKPARSRPMPEFKVLSSSVRQDGDRIITMNRVAPPALPEKPQPQPLPELTESDRKALLAPFQESERKTRFALVSATVYDHNKTLLRWCVPGDRDPNLETGEFRGWSNVDFLHLGGVHSFEYEGIEFLLIMAVSGVDTAEWQNRLALYGKELDLPISPELPADGPAYIVTEESPGDADGIKAMDGLHALYAKERLRLAAGYQAREEAREKREASLKADPAEPEDTVIHFWRRTRKAQTGQEGGAR